MSKTDSSQLELSLEEAGEMVMSLKSYIESYIFGQDKLVKETICTFLSGGHILLTGAPGLAKTTLVRVFAQGLGLEFGRVQFTPDLLPSDIIGSEILNIDPSSNKRVFEFMQGPAFVNLLLADEINRASPRTQSAMLEAMQERQVTIGGKIHPLPKPFMVFATQNPFESEGTFPLPEAQLDRFLLHSLVEYPNEESELKILEEHARNHLVGETGLGKEENFKLNPRDIVPLINRSKSLNIHKDLLQLINNLIRSSRPEDLLCPPDLKPLIWYGAGPRAGISLISASRSLALLEQKEQVRWRHIKSMAKPVLRHRIRLASQSIEQEANEDAIIEKLLEIVEEKNTNICEGHS
ncbi:MAG: AAA family ATPase [Oligoflexales bacterium]